MRKLDIYCAIPLSLVLAIILFWFDPASYNFFPKCPFHDLTGFDCPGCGSQRALHALLHGDVLRAMDYNLLLVLSLPFLIIHFAQRLLTCNKREKRTWNVMGIPLTPLIVFVLILLFTILRNIQAPPFSYLAS